MTDRTHGANCDVAEWKLGRSLNVVVPDGYVREFAAILSDGVPGSLCDVLSANGITIDFRSEKDWMFEPETGTGWIQLVIDRRDRNPDDFHVLARTITRAEAREVGAGLSGQTPAMVPLTMNYLQEGTEVIAEVAVYFTAENVPTKKGAAEIAISDVPVSKKTRETVKRRTVPSRASRRSKARGK